MRILSFNVNGIRSMTTKLKNGDKTGSIANNVIQTLIDEQHPDVLCLQEIKTQSDQDIAWLCDYLPHVYLNTSSTKKGYSGVALLSKEEPAWVEDGFWRYQESVIGSYREADWHNEGRILVALFSTSLIINVYTPNSKEGLVRLNDRIHWESVLRKYIAELRKEFPEKTVVLCGDLNCAHQDIDIHSPKTNRQSPGFSQQERDEFDKMFTMGLTDSFRFLHPTTVKYSYFSNFGASRQKNKGWRIDYCLVSDAGRIQHADILTDYFGSDHVPILVDIC